MEKTEELRLNHNLILELFDKFNMLLSDNNIDHYYTSGILPYVLTGHSLVRYHHDLDVFINMDDLERLENICEDYNFIFRRQLGARDDGTERRTLKTYYKGLDIPITLFMFVREKDGSSFVGKSYIKAIKFKTIIFRAIFGPKFRPCFILSKKSNN